MLKLDLLLARNLGCSRGQARRLLAAAPAAPPAALAPEQLPFPIALADRTVELHDSFHLLLHKPAGCVTALSDPRHPTARRYVDDAPLAAELRPVGRLDLDTTGLLLWTSDGGWLHRLTHPRSAIPRSYQVALARPHQPLPAALVLRDGHRPRIVDLRELAPPDIHPALRRPPDATTFVTIALADGAYHEVRRIFAALGSHVLALARISFGPYVLPAELPPGHWQPIAKPQAM